MFCHPSACGKSQMASNRTWSMCLLQFSKVIFFAQYFLIPSTSSCLVDGSTLTPSRTRAQARNLPLDLHMGFQEDAPPVDSPLLQEGLSNSRSVFWVLFLHKTMIWQCFLNKRNLGSLQNIAIKVSLHNSLEDVDFRGFMPHDASPDVRQTWSFTGCFGFSFRLGG